MKISSWAILLGKEDVCFGISSWPGEGGVKKRGRRSADVACRSESDVGKKILTIGTEPENNKAAQAHDAHDATQTARLVRDVVCCAARCRTLAGWVKKSRKREEGKTEADLNAEKNL